VSVGNKTDEAANAAMERYAQGDNAAFGELYDLLQPRLYGYLLSKARSAALAEDLVQQTFFNIHRARGRFARGADVLPWAFAIARRLFIDHARKAGREVPALDDGEREPGGPSPERPDEQAVAHELQAQATTAIHRLPAPQREVFEMTRLEGLSHAAAAEILGTTVTAVKMRAFYGTRDLHAALDEGASLGKGSRR
jgi:RNA polymerase sigma-70 factor (ECF subfamily)